VICVFDTLNHLASFGDWLAVFERVRAHLRVGGLFAFDVNTIGQLRRLGEDPPWVRELPGATVTQHVQWLGDGRAVWHVRIAEHRRGGVVLHHERIGELGVALARIEAALARDFVVLERCDDDGGEPSDESVRAYYACAALPARA